MYKTYCLECKTTCTLKEVKPKEVLLSENCREKVYYCPATGRTRVEKKYNPCAGCPFYKANKPAKKNNDIYIVIW